MEGWHNCLNTTWAACIPFWNGLVDSYFLLVHKLGYLSSCHPCGKSRWKFPVLSFGLGHSWLLCTLRTEPESDCPHLQQSHTYLLTTKKKKLNPEFGTSLFICFIPLRVLLPLQVHCHCHLPLLPDTHTGPELRLEPVKLLWVRHHNVMG